MSDPQQLNPFGPWLAARPAPTSAGWQAQVKLNEIGAVATGAVAFSQYLAQPDAPEVFQESAWRARYSVPFKNAGLANGEANFDLAELYQAEGWPLPVSWQDTQDLRVILGAPEAAMAAVAAWRASHPQPGPPPPPPVGTPPVGHPEEPSHILLLRGGRFAVDVTWDMGDGRTGRGTAIDLAAVLGSDESGAFWFFEPGNVELFVKMPRFGDKYGLFAFGGTTARVKLTISDARGGEPLILKWDGGALFQPYATTAFAPV